MYTGNFYNPYSFNQNVSYPNYSQTTQDNGGNGLVWVQGEAAAKAYPVAPSKTTLLMDSEKSTFYLKSADGSGMPMPLRVFDYTERTTVLSNEQPLQAAPESSNKYATLEELQALQADFEALAMKFESLNAKSTRKLKEDVENE